MGLFATHIFIVTLFVPNFYFGYFNVTAYHNPTQQLNKLFALVIWLIYCREFLAGIIVKTQVLCLLALFCVLSAISKPSFLIVFLPLAGVVALWDLFCAKYRMFWSYVFAIAVPSCLVLAWQFWITYGSGEGGIQIDPFAVVTREYLFRLPLSLAFPITVTCLMWREAAQSKRFVLTWAIFLLGMLYVCFLAEAGVRKFQGNFGWTSQTVQYLLYVESLLLTLGALGTKRRVLLSVFCVHVAFGIVYAIAAAFFPVELWA